MSLCLKKFKFSTLGIFSLLPVLSLIDNTSYAQSSEAYVYCVNEDKKWEWLKDDSDHHVKISGQEKTETRTKYFKGPDSYRYTTKHIEIKYFQIEEDSRKIRALQLQCMHSYGADYKYAQPSYSSFTDWMTFATNTKKMGPGFYGVRTTIRMYGKDTPSWTSYGIKLNPGYNPHELKLNPALIKEFYDINKIIENVAGQHEATSLEVELRRKFGVACEMNPYTRVCIKP